MPRNSRAKALEHKGKGGQWRRWLLSALIAGAVIVGALHWGDVKKFAELTARAEPMWLAGALLLQLSTYVSLSAQWWLVLRKAGSARPMLQLLPLTITKLFADQVVPTAGVSGNVLLVDRLKAIGVPRQDAVAAIILAIIAYYLSYAVGTVIALAMLINNLIAGLSGILIPVTLDKLDVDPAVSSAVFVTMMTDVMGFFSFLGLATLWGLGG